MGGFVGMGGGQVANQAPFVCEVAFDGLAVTCIESCIYDKQLCDISTKKIAVSGPISTDLKTIGEIPSTGVETRNGCSIYAD